MLRDRLPRIGFLGARLRRFGRWPRRIAALICLLLAAASAMSGTSTRQAARAPARTVLAAGQIAVPVTVTVSATTAVGDHVGLLAAPDESDGIDSRSPPNAVFVADRLRVLSVRPGGDSLTGSAATVVVVSASRKQAILLARYADRKLVLVADGLP